MADESELKELYEGIEATPEEMARYRSRLADKLEKGAPLARSSRWLWVAGPVAAALIMWVLFVPTTPELSQQNLAELQSLVALSADPNGVETMARQASSKGNQLTRYKRQHARLPDKYEWKSPP